MTRSFPAKILLFGEYGLIENSKGLTIPYGVYQGKWAFDAAQKNDPVLCDYAKHLQVGFSSYLDVALFEQEVENGLHFDSDIPKGYGIGSSGALVAAVYDRYAFDRISAKQAVANGKVYELRTIFSMMEAYFHGASSGIDPLLSYISTPLLIESPVSISEVALPEYDDDHLNMFLLNSGMVSKTTPMIELFKQKMQDEHFADTLQNEFIPCSDACIDSFLENKQDAFFDRVKELSALSLEHLQPMIPEKLHDIWKQGLQSDAYYLKLCGSGGGGYMLGFARDAKGFHGLLKNHAVERNVLII